MKKDPIYTLFIKTLRKFTETDTNLEKDKVARCIPLNSLSY
jgi:hypothetical protein